MSEYNIGDKLWYRDENSGRILQGTIIRSTDKFCIIEHDNGSTKRKAKHLLFDSMNQTKLKLVMDVNKMLKEDYITSISECYNFFQEMMQIYPEKFV